MPKSARLQVYSLDCSLGPAEEKQFCGDTYRMTAATRYANALFALTTEQKQQSAVTAAVQALAAAVEDDTVAATLANPRLTPIQRTQLVQSMVKAVKAPALLANTLGVLAANNRIALIPAVLEAYLEQNDAQSGITHVEVSSATPLSDAQRSKITKMIKDYTKASDIRLNEKLDATLKGGFRAFFNGKVWDATLSGQVSRLATNLRNAIAQRHSQS